MIYCDGADMRCGDIHLDFPSVGATENVMMAAVTLKGTTRIINAAREPEIVDLARFINAMGGRISGAGGHTVTVEGVDRLHGCEFTPMPDRIVAGTILCAAAITRGDVHITNVRAGDLTDVIDKLRMSGSEISVGESEMRIRTHRVGALRAYTQPYPGFPTDMQPQAAVLLSMAEGTSIVTEGIWDNRFRYVDELRRMGAQIQVDGKVAVVQGVTELTAAPVKAVDLRAGAAMVIAALAARGTTEIEDVYHIERGYENIIEKLSALGADIRCVDVPDSLLRQAR